MFWNMLGCSHMIAYSKVKIEGNVLYWLNNARIEIPNEVQKTLDKHAMSKKEVDAILDQHIIYRYADNTVRKIKLKDILTISDISNGLGNWMGSPSRLDALYKIISNSDTAIDAKNINLHFSGKFLVGGDKNAENIHELPLSGAEQKSIEDVFTSDKKVTAVKSMIDIKRFVTDMGKLKLDEAYNSDYYRIGSMYGIPREVLDAAKEGSTYENQEKAMGRHISYTIQPKADDYVNAIEHFFGYNLVGKDIQMTYDHLPFMQVFEQERANVNKTKVETVQALVDLGFDTQEVALDNGFDYTYLKPKSLES